MNTLEELIYYCKTPNPVGTLMLTGEWGCGKTHLVKNKLKQKLEDTHVILHVSLFGLSTDAEVRAKVKSKYWEACTLRTGNGSKVIHGYLEHKDKLKKLIEWLPWGKKIADTVISINPMDFIEVKNEIAKKKVVLVFDDLERSKLDSVELLGVINDYCENLKFNTIIITNEEKMIREKYGNNMPCTQLCFDGNILNTSKKYSIVQQKQPVEMKAFIGLVDCQKECLSYAEIKEKIVQRTIRYVPDFDEIIDSILSSNFLTEGSYKNFLKNHVNELQNLFGFGIPLNKANLQEVSEEQINKALASDNPHNLRSLKCALQDFSRIYELLTEYEFDNIDQWLYAFVIYTLCMKVGIIDPDGIDVFSEASIDHVFPCFYNEYYILDFEKNWIAHGIWDKKRAVNELKNKQSSMKVLTSADKLKCTRMDLLDESEIDEGFPEILELAYSGELNLDGYVFLIINTRLARYYDYQLPRQVDWTKVENGLQLHIDTLIDNEKEEQSYQAISGTSDFDENEKLIYKIIRDFREDNGFAYAQNKKRYLDTIRNDGLLTLLTLRNKMFKSFDNEMAFATFDGFVNLDNKGKIEFVNEFKDMWAHSYQNSNTDLNSSLSGFETLKQQLISERDKIDEQKKISKSHYNRFIELLSEIIDDIKGIQHNLHR